MPRSTAAARLPIGPAWAEPAFREASARAIAEVEAVARAEGIPVAADVREQKLRFLDNSPPAMRSSMMMDVVAGRPTEARSAAGRRGAARPGAGMATPVMATLYGVLKPFEHGAVPR